MIAKGRYRMIDQTNLDKIYELYGSVAGIEANIEAIKKDIKTLYSKIDKVTSVPAKRWESIVQSLITGLCSALLVIIVNGGL